jgi:hypothetical protein
MSETKRLEAYLATAMAGTLIGQVARQRDISVRDLLKPGSPEARGIAEDLYEMGIHPELLAHAGLLAQIALFSEQSNAHTIVTSLTNLLWSILGDPENGGNPPEIYRKAGHAMYLTFIGILDPNFPTQ